MWFKFVRYGYKICQNEIEYWHIMIDNGDISWL